MFAAVESSSEVEELDKTSPRYLLRKRQREAEEEELPAVKLKRRLSKVIIPSSDPIEEQDPVREVVAEVELAVNPHAGYINFSVVIVLFSNSSL